MFKINSRPTKDQKAMHSFMRYASREEMLVRGYEHFRIEVKCLKIFERPFQTLQCVISIVLYLACKSIDLMKYIVYRIMHLPPPQFVKSNAMYIVCRII